MSGVSVFNSFPNLLLKQTRRGCLRTICGCDAQTEIKVATLEDKNVDKFYIIEESSCFLRTFFATIHPFKMLLSLGGDAGGEQLAYFERPCLLHASACKCCCFQQIEAFDSKTNTSLGHVKVCFIIFVKIKQLIFLI